MSLFEGEKESYSVMVWDLDKDSDSYDHHHLVELVKFNKKDEAITQAYIFVDKYNNLKESDGNSYSVVIDYAYGPVGFYMAKDGELCLEPSNWMD